jgi:tripartite-type tricarboxylate transporter receptor subunit TctC
MQARSLRRIVTLTAVLAGLMPPAASSQQSPNFFKGKSINLVIGFGPGGGFDSYARVLSRHFGNHIPGRPAIVPQNMPGGGGLVAANYLYNIGSRDGLTLGTFLPTTALEPLFGNANARFDATRYTWIGNMNADAGACGAWRGSGVHTFADTMKKQVVYGSSGQGSTTTQQVLVLKNLLGSKVKIIQGYKGSADILLALHRGEVKATCGLYVSSVVTMLDQDIKDGNMTLFIQFGKQKHPEFGNATHIYDIIKTSDERKIVDLIFGPTEIGRPILGGPGIPEDRTGILRAAFDETMKDPAFLEEMARLHLPVAPSSGADVADIVRSLYATPKPLIQRAMSVMSVE